ncbi:M50 family metallopeptidase [Paenibacillus frigoriresistens]|uniref:M50 family metallopeptidase n=1 Tax=Paenibacillus alginolyticus TaxID=59839 RepID=UPI0015645408|nr:M50 family metallopeptidase [Paenibacillus frigoriresistens]NRF96122.1 M50 family metallopeptidase [Paenibacillus frigoriresistens]
MNHLTLICIYLSIAILTTYIPFIGKYMAVANTLIHEASHCLIALLFSGKVHSISLFSDTSGVATVSTRNWLSRVLVSYAGYTGSSSAAIGLYFALFKGRYELILISFILLLIVCLLFWIRNLYGFIWTISFVCIIGFIVYKDFSILILHVSFLLSAIVLAQSVSSSFIILKLSLRDSKNAGDATSLANATFIPAQLWGLLFFVQSLYSAYYIFEHFIIL